MGDTEHVRAMEVTPFLKEPKHKATFRWFSSLDRTLTALI